MVATNGGCVGHRNVLEAVDFAIMPKQQQQHPSKGGGGGGGGGATPKIGTSRSERLRNKEALLYNNKSKSPMIVHDKRRPDEADWGVPPTRRGNVTAIAVTPTVSNKSTGRSATNFRSPKRSILQVTNATPRTSDGVGPLAKATPTERLRSFDKRTTAYSTTRSITPTRTRSNEPHEHQVAQRKVEKSIRQQVEAQGEEVPFGDVTTQHQNQGSTALFQSWRKSPKRERPRPKTNETKKKGLKLFEHSREDYEERDRRRLQAIVKTVRSLEASNFDSAENSSSIPHAESETKKSKEEEESWDVQHYVSGEKLNAGLDAVEQCRNISKDENDKLHPSNTHSSLDEKPIGKTVTDWGIEAIVSDLSSSSTDINQVTITPTTGDNDVAEESAAKPATSVTEKIQQALADAKNQIYPDRFDGTSEKSSCLAAVNRKAGFNDPCSISTPVEGDDKYLTHDDTTDDFDKAARQRMQQGPKTPRESKLLQRMKITAQPSSQAPKTNLRSDRNAAFQLQHETPRHSNTQKAKSQSFDAQRNTVQRARSKSPDAMFAFGLANTKSKSKLRSRSKTPEGLRLAARGSIRNHHATTTPDRSRSLLDNSELRTPTPLTKERQTLPFSSSAEAPGHLMKSLKASLPFGRARSMTPTRDIRPQQETPSATSSIFNRSSGSQSRSLTPNRLWSSRRRSLPGLITMDKTIEFTDRMAEERLIELQRQRSKQKNYHENEESYQRPKLTPKRELAVERGFLATDGRLFLDHGTYRSKSPRGMPHMERTDGGMFRASSTGSRDVTPSRWFGRRREEVPTRTPMHGFNNSSLSSSTRTMKGKTGRFGSMLGSGSDGTIRGKPWGSNGQAAGYSDTSKDTSMISERMMKQMMTFDSLMKAIEKDKKNTLGAEFAVVELGDEETAVQTHAILMNRDDVEGQLSVLGTKGGYYA